MFKLDTADIQRLAVSALGALVLSVTCIASAVGPVSSVSVAGGAVQRAAS